MLRLPAVTLALTLLAAAPPARADDAGPWRFRTFTTRDGLTHNIVRDVLEDREGSLWFATMAGVTRYRPANCSYETFAPGGSLPRQEAMSVAQGEDGTIWVATQGGGIAAFNGRSWSWFTTRDGLPSDEITSLMVDSTGRLWATPTMGGIAMYDGQRWRTYSERDGLSSGEIGRCAETRAGEILCGTYDVPLLQRFDGRRWSQIQVDAPARTHFYVHALIESREGELWLATKGAGVIRGAPDGEGYRWTVHDRTVGVPSNRVGAIHQARDGTIWVGTSSGVSQLAGGIWRSLSRRDGLGASQVFGITESRSGALWFATLGGGASMYAPSRWERTTEADGLASDNLTGGLLLDADTLWVGTDSGVSVREGGRWRTERSGSVPLDHVNHLLRAADGAIWVATRGGVRRFAEGAWRGFAADRSGLSGPLHPVVHRLAEDRAGRIWMATAAGISSYGGGQWRSYRERDGLPSARIYDVIALPDGTIWAGTDNGVARFDGQHWRAFLSPEPANRTNRIYSLVRDAGGRIWASGLVDVSYMKGAEWRRMPANDWLPEGIYSRFLVASADGSLWFTVRGLGVRRLRDGLWTAYTTADGLPSDTVRDVVTAPDGTLLFATLGGGLGRYRPDDLPPRTMMGGTQVRGTGRALPSSVIRGEDLVLPFGGQDVLKDTRTQDLLFSYRLDGGRWTDFAPDTRAWLVDLGAGSHLFEVRAMDRDLNVAPTPARHQFRVLLPWYAEPWIIGLLAGALLLIAYAVFRILRAMARERSAVQREQATVDERRQFVRLASHELRKPLTRLAHRAEMLEIAAQEDAPEKLAEYARAIVGDSTHLSRLVETLLEQARVQQGIHLDLALHDLNALVAAAAEELAAESGGEQPHLERRGGSLEVSCDGFYLPLALRNLLDNARKYGGAISGISIATGRVDGVATVTVSDSGPGIAAADRDRIFEPFFRGKTCPEHGGFGLGLSFARDIARAHGGELALLPDNEGGSSFQLSLPLHPNDEESPGGSSADHR